MVYMTWGACNTHLYAALVFYPSKIQKNSAKKYWSSSAIINKFHKMLIAL